MNIKGPLQGHDLIEEHRDVHGTGFRHAVIALPGAVILVPLPDLAIEGGLRVDFELMHIHWLAEELLERLDEARVAAEDGEGLVISVGGEGRARRARFLAPDLLPVGVENTLCLRAQDGHLLLRKAIGKHEVPELVEVLQLFGCELHGPLLQLGALPCKSCRPIHQHSQRMMHRMAL